MIAQHTQLITDRMAQQDDRWSEAVAVSSLTFVEKAKGDLGVNAMHRAATEVDVTFTPRDKGGIRACFGRQKNALRLDGTRALEKEADR